MWIFSLGFVFIWQVFNNWHDLISLLKLIVSFAYIYPNPFNRESKLSLSWILMVTMQPTGWLGMMGFCHWYFLSGFAMPNSLRFCLYLLALLFWISSHNGVLFLWFWTELLEKWYCNGTCLWYRLKWWWFMIKKEITHNVLSRNLHRGISFKVKVWRF